MQNKTNYFLPIIGFSLLYSSFSMAAELGTYCWSGAGKDGLSLRTSLSASSSGDYYSLIGTFSYNYEGKGHSSNVSGSGSMMNGSQLNAGLNLAGDSQEMTLLKNNGYDLLLNLDNLSGQVIFTTGKTDSLCDGEQYSSSCTVSVPVTLTDC